ncbi:MAG: large repetitive protein [Verrucomicrobiota bacterium]
MGPSLVNAGIPSGTVLNDPVLELRASDGALITSNDNWKDSPQRGQIEGSVFQPGDDREAVIVATLAPGAYTVILLGKSQTTGVGLVEVYDNNQSADSQLANISTRGFVQTGNNVMIGGFILGGSPNNTRVALRGIGPSLAQFGINPVLADPILELHDGNGTTLVTNDDWESDPVSAAQLTEVGLGLSNSKESGILTSLPPGAFTAILAGKNGTTGIGLIELYDLR